MQSNNSNSCDWLIIANSIPLSADKLLKLSKNKRVLVLDGAYQYIAQLELPVDTLLGDFDSISPELLKIAYARNINVVHVPNQEQTDLEKGISYLDQMAVKSIHICAATGARLDHTLYNLRILKKLHHGSRPIVMITESEMIHYIEDACVTVHGEINDGFALLAFPEAQVSTEGLKYEVTNYPLQFANQESISNALARQHVQVTVVGAALIIHSTKIEIDENPSFSI